MNGHVFIKTERDPLSRLINTFCNLSSSETGEAPLTSMVTGSNLQRRRKQWTFLFGFMSHTINKYFTATRSSASRRVHVKNVHNRNSSLWVLTQRGAPLHHYQYALSFTIIATQSTVPRSVCCSVPGSTRGSCSPQTPVQEPHSKKWPFRLTHLKLYSCWLNVPLLDFFLGQCKRLLRLFW